MAADRRAAGLLGAAIAALVLGLYYYWFAVADRYVIFLYGHSTTNMPTTQPFDAVTSSRYWMCGLVASAVVMVLYAAVWALAGRAARRRAVAAAVPPWGQVRLAAAAPPWRQVWLAAAVPTAIGIPLITMRLNAPTLPAHLAAACVAATLAGLAAALVPGSWAAERPGDLAWLMADGLGLVPALTVLRAVELPARGVWVAPELAWLVALGATAIGLSWLLAMTALRLARRRPMPGAVALMWSGVAWSYVLLPLAHHVLGTPDEYRYISTASNFFAYDVRVQVAVTLVAIGMAVLVTRWRHRITARTTTWPTLPSLGESAGPA